MCLRCQESSHHPGAGPVSRRSMFAGVAGAGAMLGVAGCSSEGGLAQIRASSESAPASAAGSNGRFEIVLLGTQAGPSPQVDRAGISTALVVEDRTYLVDCGRASLTQYVKSRLRLDTLSAIFLTHLHIDHLADYYNYFVLGGSIPNARNDNLSGPVQVFGPGPARGLPPKFGGGQVPTVAPEHPTPGTRAMTDRCHEAYAYSSNLFMRDMGVGDVRALADVTEIELPDVGASPGETAPAMDPFPVMEDDRVKVTAILVPHGPVFPSFAFRFDTTYGSVTLSGDTTYTENVPRLAYGSDVLVHEAINLDGSKLPVAARNHMLESHVEVQKVGSIAERSDVPKLVLSHIGDLAHQPIDVERWSRWAAAGYRGEVTVGEDLTRVVLA